MKAKDVSEMPTEELESKLDELRKELIKQRAQVALGANAKDSGNVANTKRDIARILTVLKKNTKNKNGA